MNGSTCLGGLREPLNNTPVTSTVSGAPWKTAARITQVEIKTSVLLASRLNWRNVVWLYTHVSFLKCPPWILSPLLFPGGVQEPLRSEEGAECSPGSLSNPGSESMCVHEWEWGRGLLLNSFSGEHTLGKPFFFPWGGDMRGGEKPCVFRSLSCKGL